MGGSKKKKRKRKVKPSNKKFWLQPWALSKLRTSLTSSLQLWPQKQIPSCT